MKIASLLSSTVYRISVLLLTMVFTILIFYLTLGTRPRLDIAPKVEPVTPALYNAWGQYEDLLSMGMYITNFAISDFPQGLFMIDAFIWFQFDPRVFSFDTVKQFSFDKGRVIEKEFIESIKIEEELFVKYKVRFEVKSNLNFKYFPLDAHRLYIVVKYDNLSPNEVILTSFSTRSWFGYNAVSANWAYGEPACEFGYLESRLDSRSKNINRTSAASVYFDFERVTIREAIIVLLPFVALLFIILGSLLMTLTTFQSLVVAIMGILGMFVHRVVVGHMSPLTSYYMLSDCLFLLVLACATLVIIFEIMNAMYKSEDEWLIEVLRSVVVTLSSVFFLVGWFYILYIW